MKSLHTLVRVCMVFGLSLFVFTSQTGCKKNSPIGFNPAFAKYIAAYTTGQVSIASSIKIQLTDALTSQLKSMELPLNELLQTEPKINGSVHWIGGNTIEFKPNQWMEPKQTYQVSLQLNKLAQVESELETFAFEFSTKQQFVDVQIDQITPYHAHKPEMLRLSGTMHTSDVCASTALPSVIEIDYNGKQLPVRWENTNESTAFRFVVDSIQRSEESGNLEINWNARPLGGMDDGKMQQRIPGKNEFSVFMHQVMQMPDQYVQLLFSSAIEPGQDLNGLIDISECQNEKFIIENNEIRVYPGAPQTGTKTVYVHPGIKGLNGLVSKEEQTFTIIFEDLKPNVKLHAQDRVILPSTEGLVFPFDAVNLSAVEVVVSKVYENNIPQFLQVNSLDGSDEMYRVSKVIKKTTLQLNETGDKDLSKWNTFYIDLSAIIHAEPGAIYNIQIDFQREHSLYRCNETPIQPTPVAVETEGDEEEYYEEEYYSEDWDYRKKDDPCSKAYYNYRYPVSKNILASDLGIIAKQTESQAFLFAVTDLRTTKPLSGVTLDVLDFQQQVIGSVKTDAMGLAELGPLKDKAFLVIARLDQQRGYLKVGGGESLSMSTFDTGGSQKPKGLKGFIYGERGVWRPGDTLFIQFMLDDELGSLPSNHPVEFELLNTRGRLVHKDIQTNSVGHIYDFTCHTSQDSETGVYTANVRVGGATFSKSLRIENVKPNRLKLNFMNPEVIVNQDGANKTTKLHAQWLHGGIAKNLKTNVTINYAAAATSFTNWKNYQFDDPVRSVYSEEKVLFEGRLDMQGDAEIPNKIDLNEAAPGMINVNYLIKVFEESGDFSVDRFTCKYAPYSTFVGLKVPEPTNGYAHASGQATTVEIATVSASGSPVKTDNLIWKLYKVEWRYWWERNGNSLANYIGSESTIPVSQGTVNTNAQGKGNIQVSVDKQAWGRYLLRIEDQKGGHATGQAMYFDWPDESSRANRKNNEGANFLSFTCDKEKYNAGESCTVTIPGSQNATALITIENASGILRKEWISVNGSENKYTFVTDKSMAPNVYVHVSLIQPHGQTINDMPIRLYGVIPIFVEFPESHLYPVIEMPNELAPEQTFGINIKEKSGRGMSYTLAIVDEGLLDLTRHKTADPWGHFYSREALGVQTFDMYDKVIGAMGTKIEKLLSLGGDGAVIDKNKQTANRFKPVVMFLGPFKLEPGQNQNHKITMPNYVGSVRVMVIAEDAPAFGNAEKTVPVKKPLMVLATLPRVLSLGEQIALPVTIFAMDKNIKDVKIKVETNEFVSVIGNAEEVITFNKMGDKIVNFQLKVNDLQGIAKVKVRVENTLGHSAYHEIELDVRNPNPYETRISDGVIESNNSWNGSYELHGTPGSNSVKVEVTNLPSLNIENQLRYLIRYPHGCVEQTTSAAFPQLFLSEIIDLNDFQKQSISNHINEAIQRLSGYTTYDGGMGYWPGNTTSDQWGSTYAGHFLLEAKRKGYAVSDAWLTNWTAFQQRNAQAWSPSGYIWQNLDHVQQAYRLYTLALAGKPEWGAMSRLKSMTNLSVPAKWRLAAAYALAGRTDEAQQLVYNAPTSVSSYRELSYTYGSNWRDLAMIVETLVLLNDKVRVMPLLQELASGINNEAFYSTQTTAFTLIAYSKFAAKEKGQSMDFVVNVGKGFNKKVNTPATVSIIDLPVAGSNTHSFSIQNKGKGTLYVRIISNGQPAIQTEQIAHTQLYTEIAYLDMAGSEINVSQLEQGTEFYAQVRVWNPGDRGELKELALEQVFAGGWEIGNQRMDGAVIAENISLPEYQDVRDDRVFSYFDLYINETKIFRIRLTAAYAGRFYLPGLSCSPMYDESVVSRQTGQWVNVSGSNVAAKP